MIDRNTSQTPPEVEFLYVDCGEHGRRVAAVVCGHLLRSPEAPRGFVENVSDPDDLQGWCMACEALFVQEGSMTEDFLAFNQAVVVRVNCYRAIKARHQRGGA